MTQPPRNRKSPRKKDYDYSLSGVYFVTICTHERKMIFGDVVGETMQHTSLGQIAHDCWLSTPDHFPRIEVDCFVVMPNHVHAIIIIYDHENDKNADEKTDKINNNLDGGTRHALSVHDHNEPNRHGIMKDGRFYPSGVKPHSLGAIIGSYKSAVTKIANRTLDDPPSFIWQSRYHDHIIRNEREFNMIRQYVLSNPARWNDDRFNE